MANNFKEIWEEVRSLRKNQREQVALMKSLILYSRNQQQQIDAIFGLISDLKDHLTLTKTIASGGPSPVSTPTPAINSDTAPWDISQTNHHAGTSGNSTERHPDDILTKAPSVFCTATNPDTDTNAHPSPLNRTSISDEISHTSVDVGLEVFSGVATVYQGPTDQDSADFEEGLSCIVSIKGYNDEMYRFMAVDESEHYTVAESVLKPGMKICRECDNTVLRWNNPLRATALEFEDESMEKSFKKAFRDICK